MTNNTDCFVEHADSSLIGNGVSVPNSTPQGMTAAANASVSAMVRIIDGDSGGGNNVGGLLDGLTIISNGTMTVSDALVAGQNLIQVHAIRGLNVGGVVPSGVPLLKLYGTAGKSLTNVSLHDIQLDGGGTSLPLLIGCFAVGSTTPVSCSGFGNISIDGSAKVIAHGQANKPEIDIEGGNGAGGVNPQWNIQIRDLQGESQSTGEIGILCNGCSNLLVDGYTVTAKTNNGADIVKLVQPAGTVVDGINLYHITAANAWTNIVNNTITSDTMPVSSACSNGCSYHYHKNFSIGATEVWADATGRIATIGLNGPAFRTIVPNAAGGSDIGTTALPFGNIWLGTAATNNIKITAPATTAARTLQLADGAQAPVLPVNFTTTAVASEVVTVQGMTASGHCTFTPTNSGAAGGIASIFLSTPASNAITINHTAMAGWTVTIFCTPN